MRERKRVSTWTEEEPSNRERISSRLHANCRAWLGTGSQDPEIMTWAEIKSQTLNRLSHTGASGTVLSYILLKRLKMYITFVPALSPTETRLSVNNFFSFHTFIQLNIKFFIGSEFPELWRMKRNNNVYRYKLIFYVYIDIDHFEIWANVLECTSKFGTLFILEA